MKKTKSSKKIVLKITMSMTVRSVGRWGVQVGKQSLPPEHGNLPSQEFNARCRNFSEGAGLYGWKSL